MAAAFTREQVQAIAELANLDLDANELDLFARQLGEILAYADQVQQVDTSGLPTVALPEAGTDSARAAAPGSPTVALAESGLPTIALAEVSDTAGRDDVPAASLDRDLVLSQAPAADRTAGIFKVPRVLGS